MAAAEKSLGIVTPKPIGGAKSRYFQTHFDPVRWLSGFVLWPIVQLNDR
jgi:hypothetical protein